MLERKFTLKNETGFHARPASVFVKAAMAYKSEIMIIKDDEAFSAKSIMAVLSMGASKGTEIILRIDGEDENTAADELLHILQTME